MVSLSSFYPARFRKDITTIPVVRLHGTIMAGGNQFRQNLNIATVARWPCRPRRALFPHAAR